MDIDGTELQDLPAAEGEQLLGHGGGFFGGAANLVEINERRRIGGQGALEEFGAAAENHQHVVEVVGHTAGQAAKHFHFLDLAHLRFQALLLLLQADSVADVLDHRHDTGNAAVFVIGGSGGNTDGNHRAVGRLALRLKPAGDFAGQSFFHEGAMLGQFFWRNELRRLAHGIAPRNAKDFF